MRRIFVVTIIMLGCGATSALAAEKVDFTNQVLPVLQESCGKCHGEKRASAKMRLHSAAALKEKWDTSKGLITAGKPEESELYKRLVLAKVDKKRMPKGGEPLAKDKIELIARWIKEGAVLPVVAAAEAKPQAAVKPGDAAAKKEEPKKPAEAPLPKVTAAPKAVIDKLTAAGAQVMPLFADSSLLQVSFAHRSAPAGDPEIALLAGVAEQVYALNLADTKPTEAGLAPLAGLKNLTTLHLERSSVTDAGLAHLSNLAGLQYLNLYGTGITDAGLPHLKGLKNLRRLYLWQTKVSYDAAMGLEKDIPGLEVNLGYNHPVVMKMRLTKELAAARKQVEDAKAEQTKAQQEVDAAKKNADAAGAHLTDVEKQLKDLDPAAAAKEAAEAAAKAQAAAKAEADAKAKATTKKGKKGKAKAAAEKKAADAAAQAKAAADAKAAAEAKAAADSKAATDAKAKADAKKAADTKAAADAKKK